MPTYKCLKNVDENHSYKETRIPAYTDRILYRSQPSNKKCLNLLEYNSCPSMKQSDHKPI